MKCLGIVSIFTYELAKGKEKLEAAGLNFIFLSDYSTLVQVAKEKGYINENELQKLTKWRENPEDEAWIQGLSK